MTGRAVAAPGIASGQSGDGAGDRSMVVWCPDWPVRAVARAAEVPVGAPVVVLEAGRVFACSAAARTHGVRRGMRRRDAQSRCPELAVLDHDDALVARAFEPVVAAVDEISPGVAVIRPGTCALRSQGPSSYYGGEAQAAAVIAERLVRVGVEDCRVGIADGPFTAEQAARTAEVQDSWIVAPGGSARFLRDMPVDVLGDPDLASLLHRLGVRTLGAFAALPAADVVDRFGDAGSLAHRLAGGRDARRLIRRRPAPESERSIEFEPPLDRIDPVAFSVRTTAEEFVAGLAAQGLVCTTVRSEITSAAGEVHDRQWLHPRWFDTVDLVDRVRWQLQGGVQTAGDTRGSGTDGAGLSAPVLRVRFVPEDAADVADHADGLWGGAPDERIHRAMSRVQSMLGHDAVVSAVVAGGRGPAERQTLVPWGDRPVPTRDPGLPWPGSLPPPAPATVFASPRPARVLAEGGGTVGVSGRGVVSGYPARFAVDDGELRPVQAWAGPWPVEERWWDPSATRRLARFQVVDVTGEAWLLVVENGVWWAEARYD